MKPQEIRELDAGEAEERLKKLRAALSKERAVVASGTKPENPGKLRAMRRDIARILTVLSEKKRAVPSKGRPENEVKP